MSSVFISFEKSDADLVVALAAGLERNGVRTWYYLRDSLPGPSYLRQIATAITNCQAMIVVASPASLKSDQVTSEIVQAFEQRKPIVPLRRGVEHENLQKDNPEWRGAFRAATSVEIPTNGLESLLPNLIKGLDVLGVTATAAVPAPPVPPTPTPVAAPAAPPTAAPRVELRARFDHSAYPPGEDPLVYWLAEFQVDGAAAAGDDRPGADLALVLDVSGSMDKPNRYPLLCEAVRQLVCGLDPQDRVSVTLFTDVSKTVVPFIAGDMAAADPDRIIRAMNDSGMLFRGTLLAPGLQLVLNTFTAMPRTGGRARRVYVLTDGELQDMPQCETVLHGFRPQSVEVHVYGFGEDFDAKALKRLVSDQIGGTVKPIVNEADIERVFAHVATVNRRLVGQDGKLTVTLPPGVVGGDAWVYQPQNRYLGPIKDSRVEHLFGGIESGRKYSLLLEVRLPPDGPVAALETTWMTGERAETHRAEAIAPRGADGQPVVEVRRAVDILHVLRTANDKDAQLAAYRARRELATLENRDPELIAALDKLIAGITNPSPPPTAPAAPGYPKGFRPLPSSILSEREQLLLEADPSTLTSPTLTKSEAEKRRDERLLSEINAVLTTSRDAVAVMESAIRILLRYVTTEKYARQAAVKMIEEVAGRVRMDGIESARVQARFLKALDSGDPSAF